MFKEEYPGLSDSTLSKQKRKSQTVRVTGPRGSVPRDCLLLFRQPGNVDLNNGGDLCKYENFTDG